MSTVVSSYPMTAGHKYCNIAEVHVKDLNINYMKMIEVLKEENNKSLSEIQEKWKILEEMNIPSRNARKHNSWINE